MAKWAKLEYPGGEIYEPLGHSNPLFFYHR